jgi:hypothetical protein
VVTPDGNDAAAATAAATPKEGPPDGNGAAAAKASKPPSPTAAVTNSVATQGVIAIVNNEAAGEDPNSRRAKYMKFARRCNQKKAFPGELQGLYRENKAELFKLWLEELRCYCICSSSCC